MNLSAILCLLMFGASLISARAASDAVTFHGQVAPILYAHCTPCHRPGQSAPFPLITFADARKHAPDLADVTARSYMPPWLPEGGHEEFEGERRLSDAQIGIFRRWLEAGTPEGDPQQGPPPPVFPSEWQLGTPDLVVKMTEPYVVPASGQDVYRHFVLPVGMPSNRYVRAWEFRPHSRAVHHAFLRLGRAGEARRIDAMDPEPGFPGMDRPVSVVSPTGHFPGWQPGASARRNPPGLPWLLEAGADVVMQVHLQTLGKPEPVQVELGLYFADAPPTNQPVQVSLVSYVIDLPPGSTNVMVTDEFVLPADADALGVLPHMHYLGRRVEGHAYLPDGTDRPLLVIPEWDFNWQGDYTFRRPVFLPAGTRLAMRLTYDNSTNNLRNPSSPPRRVQFGLNTTDEMAELWFQLLPRTPEGAAAFARSDLPRMTRDTTAFNQQRLRINPQDGAALINLGKAALARRSNAEARGFFDRALAVSPYLDDAHYYQGLMHRMGGNVAAAAGEFTRTIELNPNHARAHGNLGLLHLQYNRLGRAAEHFARAVALDGSDALAHAMLGSIRLRQGQVAEAERLLSKAVQLNPDDAEARRNLESARRQAAAPAR